MRSVRLFKLPFNDPFSGHNGVLLVAEQWCAAAVHFRQPAWDWPTQGGALSGWGALVVSVHLTLWDQRVTVKSWLLLGMIWEGQGLRRLGRNLKPCFFPAQPFLVDRAVRESHECLASAPLYVFPAFVIELFLSISGFFAHATWGFVCSSMVKVGEVASTSMNLFLPVTGQDITGKGCPAWPAHSRQQLYISSLSLNWRRGTKKHPTLEIWAIFHVTCPFAFLLLSNKL